MAHQHLIRLAPSLELDTSAVTKKFGWVGISGSGKTYGAGKFAEELVAIGAQIVVVDVMGTWWGLRLAADGETKGIPIYLFGGQHGDIPLEPTGGALVADVIVDTRCSVVLDISEMTEQEQRRFVTDFARRLLMRKKRAKSAIHIFWEEMQDVCPENPEGKDAQKCVNAVAKLAKQGRNFGVGSSFITQRPQAVSKEVLNQVECLLAFSTSGTQEIDALKKWVKQKDVPLDDFDAIKKFQQGECFVWSPAWLRRFDKVKIAKKWTYNSSKTPEFDEIEDDKRPAPLDLAAVSVAMAETIERAKDNDPGLLRAELVTLREELARARRAGGGAPAATAAELQNLRAQLARAVAEAKKPQYVEVRTFTKADEQLVRRLEVAIDKLGGGFSSLATSHEKLTVAVVNPLNEARATLVELKARAAAPPAPAAAPNGTSRPIGKAYDTIPARRFSPPGAPAPDPGVKLVLPVGGPNDLSYREIRDHSRGLSDLSDNALGIVRGSGGVALPPGERVTLTWLIYFPGGLDRASLRLVSDYKRSSSDSYVKRLRERGFVTTDGEKVSATDAGRAAMRSVSPLPTGPELREWWAPRMTGGERAILDVLINAYPNAVEREYLDEATGCKRSSRDSFLKRLRAKRLVVLGRGDATAADALFQS